MNRWVGLGSLAGFGIVLLIGCSASQTNSDPATMIAQSDTSGNFQKLQSTTSPAVSNSPTVDDHKRAILDRKIVYTGHLTIETDDLARFREQVSEMVGQCDGVVGRYNESQSDGRVGAGHWELRIPSSRFPEAMSWFDKTTNHILKKRIDSADRTEEFVDLESRLTNKKRSEVRLQKILDSRSRMEEILSGEREIDRLREEIERIEGRLRLLSEQVAVSTIYLDVVTQSKYIAPQTETGFFSSVGSAFLSSCGWLAQLGRVLILIATVLAPWFAVAAATYWLGTRLKLSRVVDWKSFKSKVAGHVRRH
jgi:hypothetical protein